MARLCEIGREFQDQANFAIVYIKEAHPEDEWQLPVNEKDQVCFAQPKTFADRLTLAQTFVEMMDVDIPVLVDDLANTAMLCYSAWPERLYVIDTTGRIAYKGGMGPFEFDPEEVQSFLQENHRSVSVPLEMGDPG